MDWLAFYLTVYMNYKYKYLSLTLCLYCAVF